MDSHGATHDAHSDAILVVDDDKPLRAMMVAMLKMAAGCGHILESAECEAAIRIADRWGQKLKLVVVDMLMPQCSGAECAQALHKRHPSSKFLLISGDAENLWKPLEMLGRCADGLPKPFTFKDFSHHVQTLLTRTL